MSDKLINSLLGQWPSYTSYGRDVGQCDLVLK